MSFGSSLSLKSKRSKAHITHFLDIAMQAKSPIMRMNGRSTFTGILCCADSDKSPIKKREPKIKNPSIISPRTILKRITQILKIKVLSPIVIIFPPNFSIFLKHKGTI